MGSKYTLPEIPLKNIHLKKLAVELSKRAEEILHIEVLDTGVFGRNAELYGGKNHPYYALR